MLEYQVKASVVSGRVAKAIASRSEITFDATSGRDEVLPDPAELLLTSLAACMLKNVQRICIPCAGHEPDEKLYYQPEIK